MKFDLICKRLKAVILPFFILCLLVILAIVPGIQAQETTAEPVTAIPLLTQTETPTEPPTLTPTVTETPTALPTPTPTETATVTPALLETMAVTPLPEITLGSPTSTLTATITASATMPALPAEPPLNLLFADNFDAGQPLLWTLGAGWEYVLSENGLALQANSDEPVTFLYSTLGDAAVQVRLLLNAGMARLSLRQSATGSYTALLDASGQIALYRSGQLLSTATVSPLTPDQWRTLRLSAIGDIVRVAVDGIEVMAVQDAAPLPAGTLSLAGTGLRVDDVELWLTSSSAQADRVVPLEATTPPTATPTATPTPQYYYPISIVEYKRMMPNSDRGQVIFTNPDYLLNVPDGLEADILNSADNSGGTNPINHACIVVSFGNAIYLQKGAIQALARNRWGGPDTMNLAIEASSRDLRCDDGPWDFGIRTAPATTAGWYGGTYTGEVRTVRIRVWSNANILHKQRKMFIDAIRVYGVMNIPTPTPTPTPTETPTETPTPTPEICEPNSALARSADSSGAVALACQLTLVPSPTPTPIPTPIPGSCSVAVTADLGLRLSPTRYSPKISIIPNGTALTATYQLNVEQEIWYQVHHDNKDGWIAATIGGTVYVNNLNCNLPPPYPNEWIGMAQIEATEIPGNRDIDAYLRTEPEALVLARLAYGEAGLYMQVLPGTQTSGGVVYSDANRVAWIVRLDAFLGLPKYGQGYAGRSVSIIDQILAPNAFDPITQLRTALSTTDPSGIEDENVRKMVYPINIPTTNTTTGKVEIYELWIIYQDGVNNVLNVPWENMPQANLATPGNIRGFDQFKGTGGSPNCPPVGADGLSRPGSGFDWAANQPYTPVPFYKYIGEYGGDTGEKQQSFTCYQDVYHLDNWFWDVGITQITDPATNTFPREFCVKDLVDPQYPNDPYPLAQLKGLADGTIWPPGTPNYPSCNKSP